MPRPTPEDMEEIARARPLTAEERDYALSMMARSLTKAVLWTIAPALLVAGVAVAVVVVLIIVL